MVENLTDWLRELARKTWGKEFQLLELPENQLLFVGVVKGYEVYWINQEKPDFSKIKRELVKNGVNKFYVFGRAGGTKWPQPLVFEFIKWQLQIQKSHH